MSARFKLKLQRKESENDEATFEINGSDDWVKKILPYIGLTISGIAHAYGLDRQNARDVKSELDRASECLKDGRNYAGAYVQTTLSPDK